MDGQIPNVHRSTYVGIKRKGDVVHAAILLESQHRARERDCWWNTMLVVTTHLELLLKLVSGIADAFTSGLDVVDTDANVPEAFAMVFVAIGDFEVGVALRAVVVGQLDDAFAVCPVVVVGDGLGRVYGVAEPSAYVYCGTDEAARAAFARTICQEVQVELVVGKLKLVDDAHAQVLVELDAGLGIFHPVVDWSI